MIAIAPDKVNNHKSPEVSGQKPGPSNRLASQGGRDLPSGLHQKTAEAGEIKFTPIESRQEAAKLADGADKIFDFYHDPSTGKAKAELYHCKDKNHIVAFIKGPDARELLFKDSITYRLFGWGRFFGFDKSVAFKWANKNALSLVDNSKTEVNTKQLLQDLNSDQIRVVVTYESNNNKFSSKPKFICLLGRNKHLCKALLEKLPADNPQLENFRAEVSEVKHDARLGGLYEATMLLANPKNQAEMKEEAELHKSANIITGILGADRKLVVPYRVPADNKLNQERDHHSLKWKHLLRENGKLIDKDGYITLIRSKALANELISPNLRFAGSWHELHESSPNISLKEEELALVKKVNDFNMKQIEEFNNSLEANKVQTASSSNSDNAVTNEALAA